jgi:hypothetical protein
MTVTQDDSEPLRRYLSELRLQLWWREGLLSLSRGVGLGALLALAFVAGTAWIQRPSGVYSPIAVVAVLSLMSLIFAVAQRPSVDRAARQADRQRGLRNRLTTAAELLDGRLSSQLVRLQLTDALRVSRYVPARQAFPVSGSSARKGTLVGAGAAGLLIVALFVVGPGVTTTTQTTSQDVETTADAAQPAVVEALTPQQLQQMRARSATEQAALALLAEQLRKTAAARDVGQALQRGDAAAAAALLNQLAEDSDQLSQTAKQELAGALLNASKGTTALDKELAAAELAATQAMTRSSYQAARTALQTLATAVVTSQTGTLTQQQLVQQIQQLERQALAQGNGSDCGVLTDDGEFFQDCSAVGQSMSSGAMGVVSRGSGESPTAGVGEVAGGHGFATSGLDLDPLGQSATHLNLPPADVPVEVPLSNAQGSGTPADQKAPTLAISQAHQQDIQQTAGLQSSEPVVQEAERTVVAPADRAIVRDFFQAADGAGR